MAQRKKRKKKAAYDGSSIRVLKGLEAVRERPGMYLGDPHSGDALHHLIWEIVDNSVDEHLAGHCDEIHVELCNRGKDKGVVHIADNGRGIPADYNEEEGRSTLEVIMTVLHAGGKFDNDSYAQSAGLHGVGISAVNAVCEWLEVDSYRDGRHYHQRYEKGVPCGPVEDQEYLGDNQGTSVWFKWDPAIFSGVTEYDYKRVFARTQELAFLNAGLKIRLRDLRGKKPKGVDLSYSGGIREYVEDITAKKSILHDKVLFVEDVRATKKLELALQWAEGQKADLRAYTNNVRNIDGGTHLTGFRAALTRIITQWAKEKGLLGGLTEGLQGDDIRAGLTAVINLRIPNPSFSSQTKDKLVTSDARGYVDSVVSTHILTWLETNPKHGRKIVEWAVTQAKAREAAKRARETVLRKDVMDPLALPGKLADCQSKDPAASEIFIVEGDSAGGSGKQGRSRYFQAILPLRGKVLNTEDAELSQILANKEIGTLINALGCGLEAAGNFDINKLRYHKIIILTDADVDGAHIRTLLLTFFYRHMPQLIMRGHIYFGVPPLYRVKVGRRKLFFVTEGEMHRWAKENPLLFKGAKITRFKGLGEMNADTLWHTTLDPEARTLCQVHVDDAIAAEELFGILMSSSQVAERRGYIESNALSAQNVDI